MEAKSIFALCIISICVLVRGSAAADDKPTLSFANNETVRYVKVGAKDEKFKCHIDAEMVYFFTHMSSFLHITTDNDGIKDKTIQFSKAGVLLGTASPDHYDVDLLPPDYDLTIKTVRDEDDGSLLCATGTETEPLDDLANVALDLVVLHPIETVKLTLGDQPTITETMTSPVEVDAGHYKVMCVVEGSNPLPTDVTIYMHGKELTGSKDEGELISSPPRRFRQTANAEVHITVEQSMQEVSCVAKSMAGDVVTVALPIKVNVYEPTVVCNDSEAHVGKHLPVLTCVVDHEGLDVESFGYEVGNLGTVLLAGEQNQDYIEVKSKQLTDTRTEVSLHLYRAKDEHFKTFYLVVTQKGGQTTRSPVSLKRVDGPATNNNNNNNNDGPEDGSAMLNASVATLLMTLVCTLFWSL